MREFCCNTHNNYCVAGSFAVTDSKQQQAAMKYHIKVVKVVGTVSMSPLSQQNVISPGSNGPHEADGLKVINKKFLGGRLEKWRTFMSVL